MSVDTLYEIIGGRNRIHAGIDLFYQKVLADALVRDFFHGVEMNHLRAGQSMFLSMLLGGRTVYTGKDIREAHAGARAMGMTDAHFDTLLQHFQSSLREVGVEADALQKVMALLETTRQAVLGR